ncbi:MAG: GNAT family N-acetyltransferase, partial [bacterium]
RRKRQVYLPGFDTKYSSYHPGIVLTYYIIEEAIAEKYEEFDFLKGGEEYKQRFGAVKRENYKLYLYKNKIVYYIYKINLFIEKEIKEKLKDLVFKI